MLANSLLGLIRAHPRLKQRVGTALDAIGYNTTDWLRVVMYDSCFKFVEQLRPEQLEVLEIAAGPQWVRRFQFRFYLPTGYPDFDVCADTLPRQFDLVIADQVFEHLIWPYRAGRNVLKMLRPGGYFLVATPFLVRVHQSPTDCTRWTAEGLYYFLQECGFPAELIRIEQWGNRACLKANLTGWRKRGFFGSLANEPDFPVMVWAFAQKPLESGQRASSAVPPRGEL